MALPPASSQRLFLRSFAGWRVADIGPDILAGLTLAAIAVPEQMATARLGGFAPQIGFLTIIAGAVGFALLGANRWLSVGADSTITPIFAGSLATLTLAPSAHYGALAALLALMVGLIVTTAGIFRLGFIANLLSIPVITGFLAGISAHIVVSQAPALLGVEAPQGAMVEKIIALATNLGATNFLCLGIGAAVLFIILACERYDPRIPGALIALGGATILAALLRWEAHGVTTLGAVAGALPTFELPIVRLGEVGRLLPIALIISLVIMVQTAATTRSFVSDPTQGPQVDRDFIGVGLANILAGLINGFPVNASPPRTAVARETGARSQLSALICAALVLALAAFGAGLLTHVPHAALAAVLLFVAQRIFRLSTMADIWRRSRPEFFLVVATAAAIILLPIQQGVGVGILLSLLHGVWTVTRARVVEFERISGSSVWWPASDDMKGETSPGVKVVGLQAPLSFLNAYDFQAEIERLTQAPGLRLVVIEATAIIDIDYTGAQVISSAIKRLQARKIEIAFARLESVQAQRRFIDFGLAAQIGQDHIFHSVAEALEHFQRR